MRTSEYELLRCVGLVFDANTIPQMEALSMVALQQGVRLLGVLYTRMEKRTSPPHFLATPLAFVFRIRWIDRVGILLMETEILCVGDAFKLRSADTTLESEPDCMLNFGSLDPSDGVLESAGLPQGKNRIVRLHSEYFEAASVAPQMIEDEHCGFHNTLIRHPFAEATTLGEMTSVLSKRSTAMVELIRQRTKS